MDLLAIAIAAVALGALFVVARRLGAIERSLVTGESRQAGALRESLGAQLAVLSQQLTAQAGDTRSAIGDVREGLAAMRERSREIADLARDLASLEDLLRPPRARGEFGELLLERLLDDVLPGRYERQYEFPSTRTRVDAVVRMGDRLVPIDAKFPLDAFAEMAGAAGEDRGAKRRAFVAAAKRHIDGVAEKYIVPRDGTIDLAFAYIPSEAVYYQLTAAEPADGFDFRAYCAARRVLPVSPNTLQAFLAAVHLGLRGLAIQEGAKEIQRALGQIGQDLARLDVEHQKLGRHLDNARQVHDEASRWLGRVGERLRQASASAVVEPAAQPVLPLDGER